MRSITIEFGLSGRGRMKPLVHIGAGLGASFLGFLMFVVAIVVIASGHESAAVFAVSLLTAVVFIPGGIIYAVLKGRLLSVAHIDENETHVWLRGVHPDFLKTLPRWTD